MTVPRRVITIIEPTKTLGFITGWQISREKIAWEKEIAVFLKFAEKLNVAIKPLVYEAIRQAMQDTYAEHSHVFSTRGTLRHASVPDFGHLMAIIANNKRKYTQKRK